MNDQTAKADAGKAPLSLVPRRIIYDIARIREYGNQKYGDPNNWMNVEVERYRDAAFRHLLAYLDDPYGIDEESGLPHYWHLACNVAFICEMEDAKRETSKKDDLVNINKRTIKKELQVDRALSTIIYRTLSTDDKWKDYDLGEDDTISVTAKFDSEYEMDVKICGSRDDDCWTEAVLFKNGAEVCCSNVEQEFFGTWELEDSDNKFVLVVYSNGGE